MISMNTTIMVQHQNIDSETYNIYNVDSRKHYNIDDKI